MRRSVASAVLAVLLVAVAGGQALGQTQPAAAVERIAPPAAEAAREAASAPASQPALRGEYAILASQAALSEEQRAALAQRVAARQAALEAWDAENGEKLEETARQARATRDPAAAEPLREQRDALRAQRAALAERHDREVLAVLTPEQRATWEAFRLNRQALRRCAGAELTDEQRAQILSLCQAAIRQAAQTEAPPAYERVQAALNETIEREVLTDAQREAIRRRPTSRPASRPADEPADESTAQPTAETSDEKGAK